MGHQALEEPDESLGDEERQVDVDSDCVQGERSQGGRDQPQVTGDDREGHVGHHHDD